MQDETNKLLAGLFLTLSCSLLQAASPGAQNLLQPVVVPASSPATPGPAPVGSPPPELPVTPPVVPTSPAVVSSMPAAVPKKQKGPPSACIRRDSQGRFLGWVDYHHCLWDKYTFATAIWLDNSLAEDVVLENQEASMQLRAMLDNRWVEGEGLTPKLRIRAKIDLPNTEHRFKLIFSDNAENPFNTAAPADLVPNLNTSNSATGALRWSRFNTPTFKTDLDLGGRGIGPTDIYLRGQVRKVWAINEKMAVRGRQIVRYGTHTRTYTLTDIDVERLIDSNSVGRFTNRFVYADEAMDQGLQWFNALSLTHGWPRRNATLTYGVGITGQSRPQIQEMNYGTWLTYRRNIWRDWLFYHIEPQLNMARDRDWKLTPSFLLRLEVFIGDY